MPWARVRMMWRSCTRASSSIAGTSTATACWMNELPDRTRRGEDSTCLFCFVLFFKLEFHKLDFCQLTVNHSVFTGSLIVSMQADTGGHALLVWLLRRDLFFFSLDPRWDSERRTTQLQTCRFDFCVLSLCWFRRPEFNVNVHFESGHFPKAPKG